VLGAAATTPAFGIASVNVFGLRAPEEISGFILNDSTNFEKVRPGDGYGLDYSQSGWKLDVFIYDLKRIAIPEDVKSATNSSGRGRTPSWPPHGGSTPRSTCGGISSPTMPASVRASSAPRSTSPGTAPSPRTAISASPPGTTSSSGSA
jgi:hypothetical protein